MTNALPVPTLIIYQHWDWLQTWWKLTDL